MKKFSKTKTFLAAAALCALGSGHAVTLDEQSSALTFDRMGAMPFNQNGDHRGVTLDHTYSVPHWPRDKAGNVVTVDSTGAFLVGELERLDPEMHMPLAAVTWSRDITLREDVSMADENTSFTVTTFGSAGSLGGGNGVRTGKAWIGKNTNQIGGVSVDIGKRVYPLTPWALELKYTVLELESAIKLGRPIDSQKLEALQLKYQMDVDEQMYVGDATLAFTGLLNSADVTNVANVANGGSGTAWTTKTPAQILQDFNEMLQSGWAASGYAVMPTKILLPPAQFGYISTTNISSAGNTSILKYLLENNIAMTTRAIKLDVQPCKWLPGCGAGGTIGTAGNDRMVAYSNEKRFVRFSLVPLNRTPIQYDAIFQKCSYYGRIGVVEVVYPETMVYRDLI